MNILIPEEIVICILEFNVTPVFQDIPYLHEREKNILAYRWLDLMEKGYESIDDACKVDDYRSVRISVLNNLLPIESLPYVITFCILKSDLVCLESLQGGIGDGIDKGQRQRIFVKAGMSGNDEIISWVAEHIGRDIEEDRRLLIAGLLASGRTQKVDDLLGDYDDEYDRYFLDPIIVSDNLHSLKWFMRRAGQNHRYSLVAEIRRKIRGRQTMGTNIYNFMTEIISLS